MYFNLRFCVSLLQFYKCFLLLFHCHTSSPIDGKSLCQSNLTVIQINQRLNSTVIETKQTHIPGNTEKVPCLLSKDKESISDPSPQISKENSVLWMPSFNLKDFFLFYLTKELKSVCSDAVLCNDTHMGYWHMRYEYKLFSKTSKSWYQGMIACQSIDRTRPYEVFPIPQWRGYTQISTFWDIYATLYRRKNVSAAVKSV